MLSVMPSAGGSRPDGNLGMNTCISPGTNDYLSREPHAGSNKPILPVSMSRLVEIHETHVDGRPRQLFVKLGMQVQVRFVQGSQATDPHSGGREGVHPGNQADTVFRTIGIQAQLLNGLAACHHGLGNDLYGNQRRFGEGASNGRGVLLHSYQGF